MDEPFKRALERLKEAEWANSDILMVTDGEIPPPAPQLVADLAACREELGLKVHALLVGDSSNPNVDALATDRHVFRSWSTVRGGSR